MTLPVFDIAVSTGSTCRVSFQSRETDGVFRLAVDIAWNGPSTEAERKEADVTIQAILLRVTGRVPNKFESVFAQTKREHEAYTKKVLGIGEN